MNENELIFVDNNDGTITKKVGKGNDEYDEYKYLILVGGNFFIWQYD